MYRDYKTYNRNSKKVAERLADWWRLFEKILGDNQSEYTGISSLKQCLIIVAKNLRFSIQHFMILKNYKTAPKIKYKSIRWWEKNVTKKNLVLVYRITTNMNNFFWK